MINIPAKRFFFIKKKINFFYCATNKQFLCYNYECLNTVQNTVALKRRLLRRQEKQRVSAE